MDAFVLNINIRIEKGPMMSGILRTIDYDFEN